MLAAATNIHMAKASGTIYIMGDGSINPPDAPISTADNVIYILTGNILSDATGIVVQRDNIIVEGAGHTVQSSGNGIEMEGRYNVTIRDMRIESLGQADIYIAGSSGIGIEMNNIMANFQYGIDIRGSLDCHIVGNSFTGNENGIILWYSSNNSIVGNSMVNRGLGVGIELVSSSDNRIYHNNFLSDASRMFSYGSVNVWDDGYPSGGNFWSYYSGVDEKSGPNQDQPQSDGIGDTPYIMDAGIDHFPLMQPYWNPGDVNHDGKVDIFDIVVICLAYGTTPVSPSWNPSADIAPPFGKIDIFDIVTCASNYGKKYP